MRTVVQTKCLQQKWLHERGRKFNKLDTNEYYLIHHSYFFPNWYKVTFRNQYFDHFIYDLVISIFIACTGIMWNIHLKHSSHVTFVTITFDSISSGEVSQTRKNENLALMQGRPVIKIKRTVSPPALRTSA